MNEKQKKSIAVLHNKGIGYKKIADQLGISVNTIKSFCKRSALPSVKLCEQKEKKIKPVTCKSCGKKLKQTPGHRQKTFCSDKCRYAWWRKNSSAHMHSCTCAFCGKKFFYNDNSSRKFCSRECYQQYRRELGGCHV